MTRRISLVAAAVALVTLLTLVPPVAASFWSLHEWDCGRYMVKNAVCFKENTDSSGDVMFLIQNVTWVDNLGHVGTSPRSAICDGGIFNNGSWNDCASWVSYNIAAGYKVCAFKDAYYSGLLWRQTGPAVGTRSFSGASNDNISSVILVSAGNGRC